MQISNIGYNYRHPKGFRINRPHGSGDHILLLVRSRGVFLLGGEYRTAEPGCVIIFDVGTPQLYGALDGEYINDWIHFEHDTVTDEYIGELGIPYDTLIPLREATPLSAMIKAMFYERYSGNVYKEEALELRMRLLLLKIAEERIAPEGIKENRYYGELCSLRGMIYREPALDWSIDSICRQMKLSRSYVQHLYKKTFGVSIISDVTASRMEYAKSLLTSTDMSISQIAGACAYESDVHFMRSFKAAVGDTPTGFRKRSGIIKLELADAKDKPPFSL